MNHVLAFRRSDLFIPSFFSGVFTEMDYENAQRAATSRDVPVSVFTHAPYLVEQTNDPAYLQLVPYTVLSTVVNGDTLVYAYQRASKDKEMFPLWNIGIPSQPCELPVGPYGLLDIMVKETCANVFKEIGLDMDRDAVHRCLCYSTFLLDKVSSGYGSYLGLAHRINLPDIPRLTPNPKTNIVNGQWFNSEELQQLCEDGLMEQWSGVLLEEEFV